MHEIYWGACTTASYSHQSKTDSFFSVFIELSAPLLIKLSDKKASVLQSSDRAEDILAQNQVTYYPNT